MNKVINKVSNEKNNKQDCCSHIQNASPYTYVVSNFYLNQKKLIKQLICGICNIKYYEGELI